MFSLKKLLEEKGHKVIVFSMNHPKNFNSDYSKYFVKYIDYIEEMKKINIFSALKVFKRTIYSVEAKKKIENLIEDEKPDIAHLQNIHHHLTPSIVYSLKKHNIPIIWTLHDYAIICPNTSFLSHDHICERCKKRKYYWPLIERCKKKSLGASAMAALEIIIHRTMRFNDMVDVFIAPSNFLRNKLVEYGFDQKKIVCLPHFIDIDSVGEQVNACDYYLYVGRISEEKGIKTLIDAAVNVNAGMLKIAGDGPILKEISDYANSKDKKGIIKFLGYKNREELSGLYEDCKFVVVPSEWYENFPYSVLEAFAFGKPVIGSRIGGLPELIKDTERGLVFETGDSNALSASITYLLNNPDVVAQMGDNARIFVREQLGAEEHYKKLIEIYKNALAHS